MAAISATTSATPSVQASLGRSRLEQARREANQAEANAKNLRQQADAAEQVAQKSQQNVRSAALAQSRQDEAVYAAPRRSATAALPRSMQDLLVRLHNDNSQPSSSGGNALKTVANSTPTRNIQGQSTGRIVDLQA